MLFKIRNGDNYTELLFNGNIAQTYWRSGSDDTTRGYDYNYDMLNRLRNAEFNNGSGTPYLGSFNKSIAYDLNGNISSLYRTGEQADRTAYDMDILNYAYQGGNGNTNLLTNVNDEASFGNTDGFTDGNTNPNQKDYSYDANGNMVKDRNKGVKTITYNHLNLPLRISMTNFQFIDYQYNALGQKVSKTVTDNAVIKVVDYLDGFQYAGEVLQFFPHAEGYVTAVGKQQVGSEEITGYKYRHIYNYTDHLGNVRLSFSTRSNGRLEVMNENHYFPFGLKHTVYVPPTKQVFVLKPGESEFDLNVVTKTPYLYEYNGKEWQDELGLNMNDFGARNYDPALGRWMNIDPLAEVSRRFSPYTYALNNPVYFIDPDGMTAESSEGGSEGPGDVKLTGGIGLDSTMAFNFISYTGYGQNASSSKQNNRGNGDPPTGDPPADENGNLSPDFKGSHENPIVFDTIILRPSNSITDVALRAYANSYEGPEFSPYNPAAMSFNLGVTGNWYYLNYDTSISFIFSPGNFSLGLNGGVGFGVDNGTPFSIGSVFSPYASMGFHDTFGGQKDVIEGFRGWSVSSTYSGGPLFISTSTSANLTGQNAILPFANRGVKSAYFGIAPSSTNFGVNRSTSYSKIWSWRND